MSDAPDSGVNVTAQLNEALSAFRNNLATAAALSGKIVQKNVAEGWSAGSKEGAEKSKEDVGAPLDELFKETAAKFGINLKEETSSNILEALGQTTIGITKFVENLRSGAAKALASLSVGISAAIDSGELKAIGDQVSGFMIDHPVSVGVIVGTEEAKKAIGSFLGPLKNVEDQMFAFGKATSGAFTQFAPSIEEMNQGFGTVLRGGMDQASAAIDKLGISGVDAQDTISALATSGINLSNIFRNPLSLSINIAEGQQAVSGLAAVQLLAKGSSLGLQETSKVLGVATRELGYDTQQATGIFGTFNQVQKNTNLAMRDIEGPLVGAAQQLKFFGGNVETVASTYKNFISVFKEGQQALAQEVFGNVIRGLGQMGMEFRSFLGMTGSFGGAGGAIGSGLRVEKALETGEGLEGILEDLKDTLRRTTGTDILTREGAIDTGQEQQFLMQRQILQQFLPTLDPGQANKVLEMFASGGQVTAASLGKDRNVETAAVGLRGQQQIENTMGGIERSLNRLDSLKLNGIRDLHEELVSLDRTAGQFLANTLKNLGTVIGTESRVSRAVADMSPDEAAHPTSPTITLQQGATLARQQEATGASLDLASTIANAHKAMGGSLSTGLRSPEQMSLTAPERSFSLMPEALTLKNLPDIATNTMQEMKMSSPQKANIEYTLVPSGDTPTVQVQIGVVGNTLSLEPLQEKLKLDFDYHLKMSQDDLNSN